MKKILISLIFFLLISFSISAAVTPTNKPKVTPTKVKQQVTPTSTPIPTPAKPFLNWHCLNNIVCSAAGSGCAPATAPGVVSGHRAQLKTKPEDLPSKSSSTYIFVCLSTSQGNVCTSQNGELDKKILGYNGLQKLQQLTNFEPQGVFRPKQTTPLTQNEISQIKANESGKLFLNNVSMEGMEMQDYTPVSLGRKWLALNLSASKTFPVGKGGQQQGTFTFEGALAACLPISWDPYGIVFDSQSLEPVVGVKVSLNKMRNDGQFTLAVGEDIPSILNPITTIEDGAFEFYVPDGTYRLNVAKTGFIFPNTKPLSLNYKKIYSDIYRGENIIQKGAIQHRDIPVDSIGVSYSAPVKVIAYTTMLEKASNTFIIQGRVSHSLTTINIYGKKPNDTNKNIFLKTRLITTSKADKTGQFDIRVDMTKLGATEVIGDLDFIKPNYNNLTATDIDTNNSTVLSVEPILNYVEGYAYDDFGKPLVNATVGIYLNQAVNSIYETTTDENGFYKISSEYLPPMSFGLQYSQSGNKVSVPLTKFITQNSQYIEEQQEKIYSYKDQNGNLLKPISLIKQQGNTAISGQQKEVVDPVANLLLIVALVLISLGIVGLVLAIYFMKKNQHTNISE
jgi:hypothetical protein